MEGKVLADLARKLGIDCSEVLKKAGEYSRLVSVRGSATSRSLGLSGAAKSVICLELAANSCNVGVDKKASLRLSGMPSKKSYQHAYKTFECLLGREKLYSVRDLAVQFGVLEAAKLAEVVLNSYQEKYVQRVDVSRPVFPAAALYAVCRTQKMRIDKAKLLSLLGVMRSQFDKLVQEMQKISSETLNDRKTVNSKRSFGMVDRINEAVEENCKSSKQEKPTEDLAKVSAIDDYEEWKKRILEAARAKV